MKYPSTPNANTRPTSVRLLFAAKPPTAASARIIGIRYRGGMSRILTKIRMSGRFSASSITLDT
jgi:hypothetical protein